MALNHSIQDPLVLLDCQVLAINSLISMGQYQEIEDLLTSFERIGEDKKTQPLDRGYIYQMLAGVYLQLPLITKMKQKSYIDKAKKLRATFEQQAPRLAAMISFREARFVYNYGSRKKAKDNFVD